MYLHMHILVCIMFLRSCHMTPFMSHVDFHMKCMIYVVATHSVNIRPTKENEDFMKTSGFALKLQNYALQRQSCEQLSRCFKPSYGSEYIFVRRLLPNDFCCSNRMAMAVVLFICLHEMTDKCLLNK